jgi:hypothetical protein
MKKTYLQPSMKMATMGTEMMICGSQDIMSSDGDITYGGVDEEGTIDPASRRHRDVWEDVELEEE